MQHFQKLDCLKFFVDSVELLIARNAFKRALTNLIDNAANNGKQLEIVLQLNGSVVELIFDDDGPGIPVDMREEVFKPFKTI